MKIRTDYVSSLLLDHGHGTRLTDTAESRVNSAITKGDSAFMNG